MKNKIVLSVFTLWHRTPERFLVCWDGKKINYIRGASQSDPHWENEQTSQREDCVWLTTTGSIAGIFPPWLNRSRENQIFLLHVGKGRRDAAVFRCKCVNHLPRIPYNNVWPRMMNHSAPKIVELSVDLLWGYRCNVSDIGKYRTQKAS